jgi:hypothetical protein
MLRVSSDVATLEVQSLAASFIKDMMHFLDLQHATCVLMSFVGR